MGVRPTQLTENRKNRLAKLFRILTCQMCRPDTHALQTMTDKELSKEDTIALRDRVKYEDQLFNARTTIVLALNGLMAVAASLSLPGGTRLSIALVIIVVNALWILCAHETKLYVKKITLRLQQSKHLSIDEKIRFEFQKRRHRIKPTTFMCIIVPSLLTGGWILGLILSFLDC